MRRAAIASSTVELLSDSSNPTLGIAGILCLHGGMQEGDHRFTGARMYLVYAHTANSVLCPTPRIVGRDSIRNVSIPKHVCELSDWFLQYCFSLRRVTFGSSSSLRRIGNYCFEGTGIQEVSIPDSVRELGCVCFGWCSSLRRVTFGSSSSLRRIGKYCFFCLSR